MSKYYFRMTSFMINRKSRPPRSIIIANDNGSMSSGDESDNASSTESDHSHPADSPGKYRHPIIDSAIDEIARNIYPPGYLALHEGLLWACEMFREAVLAETQLVE